MPTAEPPPQLPYGAARLRWCGLALKAFVARWGVSIFITGLAPSAGASGWQQVLQALAAALHAGTRAVLLDEPLNALDRESLRTERAVLALRAASASQAWVVVSHEPLGEAEATAAALDLDTQRT